MIDRVSANVRLIGLSSGTTGSPVPLRFAWSLQEFSETVSINLHCSAFRLSPSSGRAGGPPAQKRANDTLRGIFVLEGSDPYPIASCALQLVLL